MAASDLTKKKIDQDYMLLFPLVTSMIFLDQVSFPSFHEIT